MLCKLVLTSSPSDDSEGADGEGAEIADFHGDGEEFETAVRQIAEAAEMLDDGNIMAQQHRMHRTITVPRGIDVERIDTDQSNTVLCQISRGAFSQIRMLAVRIFFGAPVLIPTGMDQHRLTVHIDLTKCVFSDFSAATATHHHAIEIRQRVEIETREILPTRVSVKRAIEIRSRIRDHLDFPDVKLRSRRGTSRRIFATEVIANHRRRQTFVSDHPVLNRVTHINQLKLTRHLKPPPRYAVVPEPESSTPCLRAGSSLSRRSLTLLSLLQSEQGLADTPTQ